MKSSIFKAIPKENDFKIPFKLKEDLLLDWLLGLSEHDSREACSSILHLLQTLNKTDITAKLRLSCLKNSYKYFKQYASHLEGSCWDASLPLSAKEQDYAEAIVWNYLALSEGFFIAAQYLDSRADEMFALYMSCYSLGQAQLHSAAVYTNPDPFFWKLVYKVFAWVEKYGLFETKINEIDDNDLKDITLNEMFAQLFIFQSCDTNQFRPRDMQTIFNFLPKACANFTTYKLSDIKFQTEVLKIPYLQAIANNFGSSTEKLAEKINSRQDLMVFDIKQNIPPAIFNQSYSISTSSLRYFTAAIVVKNLEQIIYKGEMWSGIFRTMNHELFMRVIKTLEPGRKRKHARSQAGHTMLGIIGFESIISFLYKVSHKNNPITNWMSHSEFVNSEATNENLKEYLIETQPQMGAIDGGFAERNLPYQPGSDKASRDNKLDIINKPVSLKRLTIFDSSARGYSVYWPDDESSKAKIGDIFAIISEDKKRLEIALIRRIAITSEQSHKFGTEVLGFESEIVMITRVDNERVGGWGIFIPAIKALEQAESVIYPLGNFKVGDFVYLYKRNEKIKVGIKKELNATAAIVHAELNYAIS